MANENPTNDCFRDRAHLAAALIGADGALVDLVEPAWLELARGLRGGERLTLFLVFDGTDRGTPVALVSAMHEPHAGAPRLSSATCSECAPHAGVVARDRVQVSPEVLANGPFERDVHDALARAQAEGAAARLELDIVVGPPGTPLANAAAPAPEPCPHVSLDVELAAGDARCRGCATWFTGEASRALTPSRVRLVSHLGQLDGSVPMTAPPAPPLDSAFGFPIAVDPTLPAGTVLFVSQVDGRELGRFEGLGDIDAPPVARWNPTPSLVLTGAHRQRAGASPPAPMRATYRVPPGALDQPPGRLEPAPPEAPAWLDALGRLWCAAPGDDDFDAVCRARAIVVAAEDARSWSALAGEAATVPDVGALLTALQRAGDQAGAVLTSLMIGHTTKAQTLASRLTVLVDAASTLVRAGLAPDQFLRAATALEAAGAEPPVCPSCTAQGPCGCQ